MEGADRSSSLAFLLCHVYVCSQLLKEQGRIVSQGRQADRIAILVQSAKPPSDIASIPGTRVGRVDEDVHEKIVQFSWALLLALFALEVEEISPFGTIGKLYLVMGSDRCLIAHGLAFHLD
jgi:hypothetical protein